MTGGYYPVVALGGGDFFFVTDNSCYYTVSFFPAANKISQAGILHNQGKVVEISFGSHCDGSTVFDKIVANTLLRCISDFVEKADSSMVYIYVCDTTDNYGRARQRLFDKWFLKTALPGLHKFDYCITGTEGEEYFISLLIFSTHPHFSTYLSLFEELLSDRFGK